MRTKARAILIDALRDAHRWLEELTTDSEQIIEALAAREGKIERSIRMTLSLAFLSPALANAAIAGRLPRGFGEAPNGPSDGVVGSMVSAAPAQA